MYKKIKFFSLLFFFLISLLYSGAAQTAACGDVNCDGAVNIVDALTVARYSIGIIKELNCCPAEMPVIINGTVKMSGSGSPIGGATIKVGDGSTVSGQNGRFTLSLKRFTNKDTVSVTAPNYASYNRPIPDISSSETNITLEILLVPVDTTQTINPGVTNVITAPDGASVTIPAIQGITENLNVSLTSYDISSDDMDSVPGDFTGIDENNNDVILISQGMLNVEITGAESGNYYSMEGYGTYEVVIPLSGDPALAPDVIPLWFYDTAKGKWIQEGYANREGNNYVGQVKHFSVINVDIAKRENTCIEGYISDPDYVTGDVYKVKISSWGWQRIRFVTDTYYKIIRLPTNTMVHVEVVNQRTNATWSSSVVTSPVSTGSENCSQVGGIPLQEVRQLEATFQDGALILTWQEPAPENFQGIQLEIYNTSGVLEQRVILNKGIQKMYISNLVYGRIYNLILKAVYANNQVSNGLFLRIRAGSTTPVLATPMAEDH